MIMMPHGMQHSLPRTHGGKATGVRLSAQSPREIRQREGFGLTAQIRQSQALMAMHVTVDAPMLVAIRSGRKIIRNAKGKVTVNAGEYIVITPGVYDSYNEPAEDAPYIADWIIFAPEVLDENERRQEFARPKALDHIRRVEPVYEGFEQSFISTRQALIDADEVSDFVAYLRLFETLAWLRESGIHLANKEPEIDQLVRALISKDIAHSWTAAEVSEAMAMSEATLRRRLSKLGTSLSAIQVNTRMSCALSMLQETELPINRIALDVGYESASRFAIRFRQRFGFAPSDVRNLPDEIDRFSAEVDRNGITQ
ncbi:helix-turn-helix transcriptional regulator [Celeribacter litoreus]|uniref:helix-turn-helix transcriptional regulator n=1 Tax=Celeribacter litoreus TaxID=2876714 RepID=UPI001CCB04F0|nr:AraC family transcriptional regulator [Celeribacter litoreus]MCA0042509.1 helix-turn-helix transcriptional regulator [Celeribacter litoreus]